MSTIYTIQKNLRNTIEGKERYLAQINRDLVAASDRATIMALDATSKFLTVNINELKVILHDVDKACEEYSFMGWQINPERMGQ